MTQITLNLPDAQHEVGMKLARQLGLPESELYASLLGDSLRAGATISALERLRSLARQVSREDALATLDRVPDRPADSGNKWPSR